MYDIGTLTSDITIEKQGEYASLTFDTSSNVAYFSNVTVGAIASTMAGYEVEQIINGFASTTVHFSSQGGFGGYIDFNGDGTRMVLGASTSFSSAQGRAYVYHLEDGSWVQKVDIPSPNTSYQRFGDSVLMNEDGTRIAVNQWTYDRIHIYEYTNGAWPTSPTTSITTSNNSGKGDMDWNKDGTVIVAGDGSESSTRKTYVYRLNGGTWTETNIGSVGHGVAINGAGTRVLIGANSVGKIYEANYDSGTSTWSSLTEVHTSSSSWPVRIRMDDDGTTAVAINGTNGQGRILERQSGTSWTSVMDVQGRCSFYGRGSGSISYDGTMVLTGDNYYNSSQGRAYLYQYSGGSWSLTKTYENPDASPATNDYWGYGTAMAKNTKDRLAIGMTGDDTAGADYGSVHIYTNAIPDFISFDTYNKLSLSGITNPTSKLHALPTGAESTTTYDIGTATNIYIESAGTYTVAMKGSDAFALDSNVTGTVTQVAVYDYSQAQSTEQQITATNAATGDKFNSVAIDGDYAIVGAIGVDSGKGAAYIFVRNTTTGTWFEQQKLTADDGVAGDALGRAVAIDGDYAVIMSANDDDVVTNSGALYIFKRDTTTGNWSQHQKLKASDPGEDDSFGYSVNISGDYIITGAQYNDDTYTNSGSAYIYTRDPSTGQWGSEQKLTAIDAATNDYFGSTTTISGGYAFVGARGDDDNSVSGSGSVYVFKRNVMTGVWSYDQKLTASDPTTDAGFGGGFIAISGDYLIIGANAGGAYIFKLDTTTGTWSQQAKLTPSDGAPGGGFGSSVSIDGDYAIVGAISDKSAYIYKREGTTWSEQTKVTVNVTEYGGSVAISGGCAFVGARGYNTYTGAVYIYKAPNSVPKLDFDTYNKLTFTGADTDSTYKLKYESNTYDLGTISNVYIAYPGTYSAEIKGATNFGLSSNITGSLGTYLTLHDNVAISHTTGGGQTLVTVNNIKGNKTYKISFNKQWTDSHASYSTRLKMYIKDSSDGSIRELASIGDYLNSPRDGILLYDAGGAFDESAMIVGTGFSVDGGAGSQTVEITGGTYGSTSSPFTLADPWYFLITMSTSDVITGKFFVGDTEVISHFLTRKQSGDTGTIGETGNKFVFEFHSTATISGVNMTVEEYNPAPKLDFDGYNKLTFSGLESGSTSTLKYGSNTYSIGTASNVYISEQGTYEAESKGTTTFALTSTVVGTVTQVDAYDYTNTTEQKLTAGANAAANDRFGESVAVSGDYAIAGARSDPGEAGAGNGAAYIFVRNGTSLTRQARIVASDGASSDQFGYSVAIDGDYAIVGAPGDDSAGSAYIFLRSGTSWAQQAKLTPGDGASSDNFGSSVSISGNYAIIGAYGDDSSTGAAYIFLRSVTSWAQQVKLTASDAASNDRFGWGVSISGNYAVIGAPNNNSAYIFLRDGASWGDEQIITASDVSAGDNFGNSVAIVGDDMIVGSRYGDSVVSDAGSAYVFKRSGTSWSEQSILKAGDIVNSDYFGESVAIYGDYAIVGAPYKNSYTGAVYIFNRTGTNWTQQAKIIASDGASSDFFGKSVAIYGDYVFSGSFGDDDGGSNSGAAYIYIAPNTIPKLTHDGYKLVVKNITPTSSTLKYESNTYEIGTATNIYVENTGDYSAEIGNATDFVLTNTTVSGTIKTVEPGFASRYQGSMALTYDGKLYAWGMNDDGEAGVGTPSDITVPTLCTGITQGTVAKLLSGSDITDNSRGEVSYVKTIDGKIYATGKGVNFVIPGTTSDLTSFTDVTSYFGDQSLTANTVTMMSFTQMSGAALTETGNVWTWGTHDSTNKALGQASASSSSTPKQINFSSATDNITKITCGSVHSLALDSSGDVWFWGKNTINSDSWPSSITDEPQKVVDGKNIIGLASSYGTMYAWDATGKMWNAGNNWEGQIGDGTTTSNTTGKTLTEVTYFSSKGITINKVYGGGYFVFADTSDGYYCWGSGGHGVFGNGSTGDITSGPAKWTNVSNIKKFMASTQHTTAITEDGKYYAWGRGYHQSRGDNDTGDISYPKYIDTLPNILAPSFDFDGYDKILLPNKAVKWIPLLASDANTHDQYIRGGNADSSTNGYWYNPDGSQRTNGPELKWDDTVGSWILDSTTFSFNCRINKKNGTWSLSHDHEPGTQHGSSYTHDDVVLQQDTTEVWITTNGGAYIRHRWKAYFEEPYNYENTKYTKDTHTYDANQAQIVTVSDPGTYDAQIKDPENFALKSATIPATSSTGLYTWAFHHGNFDNAYGDGDILTARDNGRFYADTPSYTGDIGTITPVNPFGTTQPTLVSSLTITNGKALNTLSYSSYVHRSTDTTNTRYVYALGTLSEDTKYDIAYNWVTKKWLDIDSDATHNTFGTSASDTTNTSRISTENPQTVYVMETYWNLLFAIFTNPYYQESVSSTTYTFTPASTLTANVLMVAGGGGGGGRYTCGGGGAGGLVYTAATTLSGTKTIVVGNGDSGGNGNGQSGYNGKDTTFTELTPADGGGYGGTQGTAGGTGGSGGGGGGQTGNGTGGSGTANQGNAGGTGSSSGTFGAGGGGGSDTAGSNGSSGVGGSGGSGKFFGTGSSYTDFGDEYGEGGYFAGGGGGGTGGNAANTPGTPGRGGGGYGATYYGYMGINDSSYGGSQHALPHTGGGGGGSGVPNDRDQHPGYASINDGGVMGHGGRGGSGIVLIQTNIALPNGANTAVVQVGNPRRRSLPPAVSYMGSEVNRFSIIDSASMPTYKLPTHWYVDPNGYNGNSVFSTQGSHSLQKRADGGTSNVFYVTSTEGIFEYGSYMAQSADAIFMPVEAQRYNGLLAIGSNSTNDIHFEMAADGTAALYYDNGATLLSAGTITCFTVGKWHHIALTVDSGGNAVGYVNGYPVVSGTHTSVAAVGSRSGNMHMRVGDHSITFRKFLTYEVSTYNFHMSPKQVLQRAAEVGLGPKLEYDGLNAINVVNTEPGSGTEITIYESNVNDTSNLYVVSCNESSYLLSNAGTYYAQIKGTDTFTITRPLTVTDDHFPLYQYPPIDGTTTGLTSSTTSATWTISGVQYSTESSVAGSPYNTFDNSITSGFDSTSSTGDITITFQSAKTIRKYIIWPYDSSAPVSTPGGNTDPTLSTDGTFRPKSWTVYGTNNLNDWSTVLDTVTNQPPSIYGDVHSISSPASYQYYKLSVTANNGGSGLKIGEWQLWGDA